MLHLVLLFLHVTSAMVIVAGFGIEGFLLQQLRAARGTADARVALGNSRYVQLVTGIGLGAALVTGIYLAAVYWHWRGAWMGMAFLSILLLAVVGGIMTGRPTARLLRSGAEALGDTDLPSVQRVIGMSYMIRVGLFLGIVFLMTTKPVSGPSALLVVLVSGALGFLAGLPTVGRRPAHA